MSERGDLLELVCDASGRVPRLSAKVRSWRHTERQRQAMEESRRLGLSGAWPLYAGEPPAETEQIERLLIDPRRHAYRVEYVTRPVSMRYGALWICDGTTTWTQIGPDEFHRQNELQQRRHLPTQATPLLDPSWLTGYQWEPPVREAHNGRDVLVMHVRLSADHAFMPRAMAAVPADAEVVIDKQFGFLHRLTGLVGGEPYHVIELLDLVLDPELDENIFGLPTQHKVIDDSEWARRIRGPLPPRIWRTLTAPFRRHRHRPKS